MYESYFGLTERPFSIAPDPQYLYMSGRHKEAMAHLSYGLSQGGCFIVLIGEVGTGKTTLCRNLLMELPEQVDVALILNANISEAELLQTICDELKIKYNAEHTQKQLLDFINQHLLDAFAKNRHTVLIIDEAQLLSRDVLEQIRLLTNLETTKSKLLQIILIGQPELSDMLVRNDLRQLAQRVTARYHLDALEHSEIEEYVNFRLSVAGCRKPLFTKQALTRLHHLTNGIPRKINVLTDHALLSAYSQSQQNVDSKNVQQAANEVFFKPKAEKKNETSNKKWWAVVAAALLFNGMLWWFFSTDKNDEIFAAADSVETVTTVNEQAAIISDGALELVSEQSTEIQAAESQEVVTETQQLLDPVVDVPVDTSADTVVDINANTVLDTGLFQSGSVVISEEFLDAEDGVVETVQNPQILGGVDFDTEIIQPTLESAVAAVPVVNAFQPVLQETEFGRILETSSDVTGRYTAFRALVGLWGSSLPNQIIDPLCTEAANNNLRCLGVSNWQQILRYNRPTVMVLRHDNQLHRVIVDTVDGDAAEVRVGDSIYRISVAELLDRWNGSALTVWRPSEAGFEFLQLGNNRSSVTRVRSYLNRALVQAQIGTLNSESNTLFDQNLAQKVFELQIAYNIISDSKIGDETYLLMNELVSPSTTPRLVSRAR